MINEQDKQKILNGAYGVSRNGTKCKYIGRSQYKDHPHIFMYIHKDGFITNVIHLTEELKGSKSYETIHDIVDLWEDKPAPFNLEKALAGEPVILRDGTKAYVKYVMPKEYTGAYPLQGYYSAEWAVDNFITAHWTLTGKEYNTEKEYDSDIIGMWKESEPVSNTITLTLPCPLKEPKNEMWFIKGHTVCKSKFQSDVSPINFEQNIYFDSKENAQTWLNAMRNNRK